MLIESWMHCTSVAGFTNHDIVHKCWSRFVVVEECESMLSRVAIVEAYDICI